MEIKIFTLTRLVSPFLLCSTATDNLPIHTQAAEAALLLFQTSPPWKTSAFPTCVYSKTLLRNPLATRSAEQAQRLGNTCARSSCVFLGACLAGLFLTRHNPALLVKLRRALTAVIWRHTLSVRTRLPGVTHTATQPCSPCARDGFAGL